MAKPSDFLRAVHPLFWVGIVGMLATFIWQQSIIRDYERSAAELLVLCQEWEQIALRYERLAEDCIGKLESTRLAQYPDSILVTYGPD